MLGLLHIENVAVIARADVSFRSGLNALTGETGAGKSIIIDSIGALVGERASRDLIRTGEKSAFVSGAFSDCGAAVAAKTDELGLSDPESGELVISRTIFADGRNVCRVNGRPASLAALRELGELLIVCHGQHDSRLLLDTGEHMRMLDRFARDGELLTAYQAELGKLKALHAEQKELAAALADGRRRLELARFTINEVESFGFRLGEEAELRAKLTSLRANEKIASALTDAESSLSGGEGSDGGLSAVEEASSALSAVKGLYGPDIDKLADTLADAVFALRDADEEISSALARFDFSESELDALETRLDKLSRLEKKYGGTEEAVLEAYDRAAHELETLETAGGKAQALAAKYQAQYETTMSCAKALSEARASAVPKLEAAVNAELEYLCMSGAKFEVESELRRRDGRVVFGADGIETCEFFLSANRGETRRPLAKTASGGELSRIMLALDTVTFSDGADTLIFDEIDAGISGIAANRVAERLSVLSARTQVLCVTHLSQLAAFADAHFRISKSAVGERTLTKVDELDDSGRMDELARINGGEFVSDAARKAAFEQLSASRERARQIR